MTPMTRSEAVDLLKGVPFKSMSCMIEAVKLTYEYNDSVKTMCMEDEVLDRSKELSEIFCAFYTSTSDSLSEEVNLIEDPSNFGLLQLVYNYVKLLPNALLVL